MWTEVDIGGQYGCSNKSLWRRKWSSMIYTWQFRRTRLKSRINYIPKEEMCFSSRLTRKLFKSNISLRTHHYELAIADYKHVGLGPTSATKGSTLADINFRIHTDILMFNCLALGKYTCHSLKVQVPYLKSIRTSPLRISIVVHQEMDGKFNCRAV